MKMYLEKYYDRLFITELSYEFHISFIGLTN